MTGGSISPKTTEFISITGGASISKDLPWEVEGHCVTNVDTEYAIITGGTKKPKGSIFVNLVTFEMIPGPELNGKGRKLHACTYIRRDDGSIYVIAAGGNSGNVNVRDPLKTTDILRIKDQSIWNWSKGNKLI